MTDLSEGLVLSLVGLGIVFGVLSAISMLVFAIRRADDRWQREERQADIEAVAAQPTVDTLTLALIAAAVATLLGGRGRIRRIRRVAPAGSSGSVWSAQGRISIQGSHAIHRKRGSLA